MSADNIDRCPICGEWALREWFDLGIHADEPIGQLRCSYECHCYECGFKWSHEFPTVNIPKEDSMIQGGNS